ncbi:unnamed protein product [Hermetia illucens]|uniref:Homeobox domain-containing protein n=1 Tax=Hermetia illucens TaxID=343691 RepID=A0A7R8UYC2_HERIL|nr:unnamed protein product [Hermetia illucens]
MASSRLRFLEEETLILEDKYQQNPRPTSAECQILAERFNVTSEKVRVWFKNRRAKALKKPDNNKRRSRVYINSRLAAILEKTYMNVSIPDRQLREDLSLKTGLSTVQVKVWFQNRRAKDKKDSTFDQRRNIEVDTLETHLGGSGSDKGNGKQMGSSSIEDQRTCSEPSNVSQIQANGKVTEQSDYAPTNSTPYESPQQETLAGSHSMLIQPKYYQQSTVPATHYAFQQAPSYCGQPSTIQNYRNPTVPVQSHTNYQYGRQGYNGQHRDVAAWRGGYHNYSIEPQFRNYNAPIAGVHYNPSNAALNSGDNNCNSYYNSIIRHHYAYPTQSSDNGAGMVQHFKGQQSWNYGMSLVQNINGNQTYNLPGPYPMPVAQNDGEIWQSMETAEQHYLTNLMGVGTDSSDSLANNPTVDDLADLLEILDGQTKSEDNITSLSQSEVDKQLHRMENIGGSELLSNGLDIPHDTGMIQSEHNIDPLTQDNPDTLQVQMAEHVARPQNESVPCQIEEEFVQQETNDDQIHPDDRSIPQDEYENANGFELVSSGLHILREVMDGCTMPSEHNVKNVTQDDPGVPQHPMEERGTNGDESVSFQFIENSNANVVANFQDETCVDQPHLDINETSSDRYNNGNPISTLLEDEIYIQRLLGDGAVELSDNTSSTNHREPDNNVIPILKNVNLSADLLRDGVNFVFELAQPEVDITNTIREIANEDNNTTGLFLDEFLTFK